MNNLQIEKEKLQKAINNSIWGNDQLGIVYKFQNGKDLNINGNPGFEYKIEAINDNLILNLSSDEDFIITLIDNETIALIGKKQSFDLYLKSRL